MLWNSEQTAISEENKSGNMSIGHSGETAIRALAVLAMIITGVIGIVCFEASAAALVIFLAYIVLYVLLPGLLIYRWLGLDTEYNIMSGKHRAESGDGAAGKIDARIPRGLQAAAHRQSGWNQTYDSLKLATSFFLGWAAILIVYFISDLIKTDILLYAVGPVLSIVYIIGLFRGRKAGFTDLRPDRIQASFYVFAALVFFYAMLNTQYEYIAPLYTEYTSIISDQAFHLGIIEGLARDFPAPNLWIEGRDIHYHIFTEILYAIPVRLFGLESTEVVFTCGPYLTTAVVSCTFYGFLKAMTARKERAGLYCMAILASCMFMVKGITESWFLYHLLSNINSYGFGVSALMIMIPTLSKWNGSIGSKEGLGWRDLVIQIVFVMLMTGIKGPIGIVFIGGIWGTVILGLIMRKMSWRFLVIALILTLAFLIIYVGIIGTGSGMSTRYGLIRFGNVVWMIKFKGPIIAAMKAVGIPKIIRKCVMICVFIALFFAAFLVPAVAGYIREFVLIVTGGKEFRVEKVFVYAAALVGLIAMFIFNHSGHSQVYYGFVTLTLTPLISFWLLEDLEGQKTFWPRLLRGVFAVMLIMFAGLTVMYYGSKIVEAKAFCQDHGSTNTEKYINISHDEYEGMMWLRDNTPEDALVISDRYYSVSPKKFDPEDRYDSRHFVYGIYSERQQYIEGSGYSMGFDEADLRQEMIDTNNRFYDPDDEDRDELAQALGADYVVVSKRFNDAGDIAGDDYELCFSNDEIDIYKILPAQ